MKIAIVGMKHSGSTMLFYMVRHAISMSGKNNEIDVVKSHEYVNHEKVIATIRDPRDTSISGFMRFSYHQSINGTCKDPMNQLRLFGVLPFLNYMRENILLAYDALSHPQQPFLFVYEEFHRDPVSVIKNLFLDYLDLPLTLEQIETILDQRKTFFYQADMPRDLQEYLRIQRQPLEKYDRLLTRDHDTSGGSCNKCITFFPIEYQRIILEDALVMDFLKRFSYVQDTT